MAIRSAKISFKDHIAGSIEETATGGTRFTYSADWRDSIACVLPISRREHEWQQGLHPFFQHLGPEGWLRERQARVAHIAEEDDLGLLLLHGADCIGAVGVLPISQVTTQGSFSDETANPRRTVSGVQRKLLVVHDEAKSTFHPAPANGPAPFIAKFGSTDLPTLVRNENLSLNWVAAVLGPKEVTEFRVSSVAEVNEQALVVTRFDRTPEGAKLRAEDFAQILAKPRGQDYSGKYEASYEQVADVIKAHSVRPQIDLLKLLRRLIAFAILANGDAHLKNFTLLERPEGLRLSPVYDVVNVGVYARDGINQRFGLAIGDEVRQIEAITATVLREFGLRAGLSKKAVDEAFRDIKTRAERARAVLPAPDEGRDEFGTNFTEVVRNGCVRLLEA
ncbi:MAG TPA: HipA domain-containing protein [Rhizomicrobium sp.]|nr:HipA domain-containing protein [Rhizomicrobium sp.]